MTVHSLVTLEYDTRRKVRFVVVALPTLGILGGALRIVGLSETAALLVVSLLLTVAFALSVLSARMDAQQETADATDRSAWRERDQRLRVDREARIARQLKEVAERHRVEREALIHRGASREQLTAMIEHHSDDWDELIQRLIA